MEALVLIVGLLTGDVPAEAVLQQPMIDRSQAVVYAQVTDTRTMTDDQINRVYMTPDGWDAASWAAAVRTINLNVPAGRLLRY